MARSSSRSAGRLTPLAWLSVALVATVIVLPSSLRPPPDQTNTSAEFSPDAPPDDAPEAIIQSLQQAASQTAGGRREIVEQGAAAAVTTTTTTLPPPIEKPSKGQCFGDPPRQTDSFYAAPCAPAFVGDNGGSTYTGVDTEEVRVAVIPCSDTTDAGYTGPTPHEPPEDEVEGAKARTYRVLQKYFNENFELYGRKIRFVPVEPEANDAGSGPACAATTYRTAMVRAAEEYDVFGAISEHPSVHEEGLRRKLMMGGIFGAPASFYTDNYPYEHAWEMGAFPLGNLLAEFLCKQVVGQPPQFNEQMDINFDYSAPRKLGLILFEGDVHNFSDQDAQDAFMEECGEEWDVIIRLNTYDNNRNQALATGIATMKAENVTTVMLALDFLTAGVLTHQSTQQQYWPEWLMCGCGAIDRNELIQLFFDTNQWKHAFGVYPQEIARPQQATDWWRAYKSVDPDNDPNESVAKYLFQTMQQYVNGIQRAGPTLTPETFMQGLISMGYREPVPKWSIGGGYGPGDYTYGDYVSLVWFDQLEPAPDERNQPGAYRHMFGGQRYKLGEIPEGDLPWFEEGIAGPPPEEL